jgi:hypothetical protein
MNKALAHFVKEPLAYDLREMVSDEEMQEMAQDCENLRKDLYTHEIMVYKYTP